MSRHTVTLTYQFLGRACDRVSALSNTLPAGPREQLAKAFSDVLQAVKIELDEFVAGSPSDDDIEQRCKHISAIVDRFSNLLFPIFERPESHGIINNLTLPILRFSPNDSHYIGLVPADELNFGTHMISLQHIWSVLSFQEDKINAADPSLRFFIKYPHLLSNDTLSLVVLGHEISHVWYQLFNGTDAVAPLINMDSVALGKICDDRKILAGSDEQFEFYSRLQSIAAAWAEEITCDIAAVHLLGPAALFSYERTVQLSGGHNIPTTSHPDSAWRCRLMLEQLSLAGFALTDLKGKDSQAPNVIPGCITEIERLTKAYGTGATALDPAEQVAHDAIVIGLPKIRDAVVEKMGVPPIKMENTAETLGPIVEAFSNGHPISDQWHNGENAPLETRWLAFALWETYLRQQSDTDLGASELHKYESDLASQFSRACNAAEVLARWREKKNGGAD